MAVSILSFRTYVSNLSGRRLGAFKAAAAKIGVTFDEYVSRIERGEKFCIDCREWRDRGLYCSDSTRWDGLSAKCIECQQARYDEGYECEDATDMARKGPVRSVPSNDKETARSMVNHEVAVGKRPNPNHLFCVKCGHKGSDKRHEYHHHMGYSSEHVFDVVPLCSTCHHEEH
ncbi:MAG: hypothetical protein JNK93_16445 [Planctomycetia bacterium]|nr:hypothetical protein [Planctomycetia bacterium]